MADKKIWSPDLSRGTGPLYLRLVDAMAAAIEDGTLAVGQRLPPQRQLAWQLEINLSTVTKAFQEATKRHLIAGEVGRGTYVLARSAEAALFELSQGEDRQIIDLSTHLPIRNSGEEDLQRSLQELLADSGKLSELLDYHSPQALLKIRMACARWWQKLGFPTEPQRCIATSSAQHGLLVSLLACCGKEDWVLVDELTFPSMKTVAKQLGLKLHGVKQDSQGITPEGLDLAIRSTGARVLVSDPILQNPTATCMGESRRKQVCEVLRQQGTLFIEEFVIGSLCGEVPVSAAIPEQSLVITSFAKTVAPGLRFATITGGHSLIEQLNQETHSTSWQLSPLISELACRWIENGTAERRLQWQWQQVQRRYRLFQRVFQNKFQNKFQKELQKQSGDRLGVADQHPCSHVWLPVRGDAGEAAVVLKKQGVVVVPSSLFAVSRNYPQCIRVSLSAAESPALLKVALERIRESGLIAV